VRSTIYCRRRQTCLSLASSGRWSARLGVWEPEKPRSASLIHQSAKFGNGRNTYVRDARNSEGNRHGAVLMMLTCDIAVRLHHQQGDIIAPRSGGVGALFCDVRSRSSGPGIIVMVGRFNDAGAFGPTHRRSGLRHALLWTLLLSDTGPLWNRIWFFWGALVLYPAVGQLELISNCFGRLWGAVQRDRPCYVECPNDRPRVHRWERGAVMCASPGCSRILRSTRNQAGEGE